MTKHKKTVAILDRQFINKVHELEQICNDRRTMVVDMPISCGNI